MCGIAGFVGKGSRHTIQAMTDCLAHRGPDGQGVWADAQTGVHLGHRILSIVDLAGGAQPMWNASGSIGVVYNGEIYNHMELRAELEALGHVFMSSHSDTEVLIHGYAAWGTALPKRLNGMFAFAIYDRDAKRLLLSRDRFGEKPLYYAAMPNAFVFGSEVTALLLHPSVSREMSIKAAQKFFAWGFFPSPYSLYRDIRKLPAGHSLIFDINSGRVDIAPYWQFHIEPDESLTLADQPRLAEELRGLLTQSVRRRLMSDVPLGLFLSGGIDSSAILAAATRCVPAENVKTFTVGFTEPSYDESHYARSLAAKLGVKHNEKILDLENARVLLPEILRCLDEPLGDPSILPTHLLSRFARQHVTVALSGDGGDELFAGYDPFKAVGPAQLYSRLVPRGLHRGLRSLAEFLPRSTANMSFDFKVRRTLLGLSWPSAMWNPIWLSPANPEIISEIFESPLTAEELYEEAIGLWSASDGDLIDKTMEFYTTFYLQDNILTKVDRATMLTSLESRAIFLDNDLVEFCRRLPNRFKFRDGRSKVLLREALGEWLPADVLSRRKKGFGIPLTQWLRTWNRPQLPNGSTAGLGIRTDEIDRRWSMHARNERDERLLLFAWESLAAHLGRPAVAVAA